MKPKSPTRLMMKAFLPAAALASSEPERDQEVGAGAHALPAEERDQEVRPSTSIEHREDEQVQVGEEPREVRVAVHVADRVQVDQRADAGDEQRHRDRERVDEEADVDVEPAGGEPGEQLSTWWRSSSSLASRAMKTATVTSERAAGGRWPPAGAGLAEALAEDQQHHEAGERQGGDEPDEIEHRRPLALSEREP